MKRQHPHRLPFARRKLAVLVATALSGAVHAAGLPHGAVTQTLALPITFERNDGQFPADVMFVSRGSSSVLALKAGGISIVPTRASPGASGIPLRFVGSNLAPEVQVGSPLVTRSQYYPDNVASHAVLDVPHFDRVRLKDVYPGIDVALHGNEGALEYDFIVAPHSDPRDIRIDLRDAKDVAIDERGALTFEMGGQRLTQHAPIAWQGDGAARRDVQAHFALEQGANGLEARVELAAYDPQRRLTIDPVLAYATVGGIVELPDAPSRVAVDTAGAVYSTQQVDYVNPGYLWMVVTKNDPVTHQQLWQSYIYGTGKSEIRDIEVDNTGHTYLAGNTTAMNFPAPEWKSDNSWDAFVMVLDNQGHIGHSRLIGGSGAKDQVYGMTLDTEGHVFISGSSQTPALATVGPVPADGYQHAFVAKLDSSLATSFFRYIGGSSFDVAYDIALDKAGRPVVAGFGTSADFPQVNVGTPTAPGPDDFWLAFTAKLTADGSAYVYSQRIAGTASDGAFHVAVDPVSGDSWVGGYTEGADPAVPSTRPFAGGYDAFLLRFSPEGQQRFSTLLGGTGGETVIGMAVAPDGDLYVSGTTSSPDFPFVRPLAECASLHGSSDAYVARFRDNRLDFATCLGGSGADTGGPVALDHSGGIYLGGTTDSTDFPVPGGTPSSTGTVDGFVAHITGLPPRTDKLLDLDLDFRTDLLGRHTSGYQGAWTMNGTAASAFTGMSAGSGYDIKLAGDFNGDGKSDVVYRGADGSYRIQLMDGGAVIADASLLGPGTGWEVVGKGDFNGDGKTDLLWKSADGTYGLWLMNGTTFSSAGLFQAPGVGWDVALVADFNGDGKSDILWKHTDGRVEMWLMDGFVSTAQTVMLGAGTGWSPTHAADFNGDGKADLVWKHQDGSVGVWLVDGTTILQYAELLYGNTGWSVSAVGDLDGDGKADVVITHANGTVGGWLMNGASIKSSGYLLGAGTGWSVVGTGDYNGDGRTDLLWRANDGSYGIWIMNGLTYSTTGLFLGPGTGWTILP